MKAESISYKDFRTGKFKRINKAADHPILVFLKKYPRAFNVAYIMKAVGTGASATRSMLRKLVKNGVVLQKPPFFAYKR